MADVIKNEEGQLMLLTVFLIIIGVVSFTSILNSMIYSSNLQSSGLEESKQEIRDFRIITESEVSKAAYYADATHPTNQTLMLEYFYNYIKSFNETVKKIYSSKGASVDVIVNNISLTETTSNIVVNKYSIELKTQLFHAKSIVIPMDENQTQMLKVYGLVYKILDSSGTQPLNQTQIPVWIILQNPVNDSVSNFSISLYTDDNATTGDNGVIENRTYSGGPFIIDFDDVYLNETIKNWILDEAKKNVITVHELKTEFTYDKSIQLVAPPKIAIYPSYDATSSSLMKRYYDNGDIPYTLLNDSQVQNSLAAFDILNIAHHDMRGKQDDVYTTIAGWVANGGFLHLHCYATWTMDEAVENSSAGPAKPWYGFIGVNDTNESNIDYENMTYGKFVDTSSKLNDSLRLNSTPLVPLSGLADPGSPFSPLAQSSNKSGMMTSEYGLTELFTLRNNADQINPSTNILAHAAYSNGSLIYEDFDDPADNKKEAQLIYVEAPYENGLVSYLAGRNQSERVGGERLVLENAFAASMKTQLYSYITSRKINVTIKYFDGSVRYTDTFIINS